MIEHMTTKYWETEKFVLGATRNKKTRVSLGFTFRCEEAKTKFGKAWKNCKRQRTQEKKKLSQRA